MHGTSPSVHDWDQHLFISTNFLLYPWFAVIFIASILGPNNTIYPPILGITGANGSSWN